MIALGVMLHLGIDWSLRVGFFSYAIFAAYLAFLPPDTASKAILRVRNRVKVSRLVPNRAFNRRSKAQPVAMEAGSAPDANPARALLLSRQSRTREG